MDPSILEDNRTLPEETAGPRPAPRARQGFPSDPAPAGVVPVKVRIEYCAVGNHEKVARSLVDALGDEFPGLALEVDLAAAAGGVFEVRVNDRLVHSKRATHRFPSPDEVFYHVRAAASGSDRETASS
jgi:selT/selW/selH-like putative selenoprotein